MKCLIKAYAYYTLKITYMLVKGVSKRTISWYTIQELPIRDWFLVIANLKLFGLKQTMSKKTKLWGLIV